MSLVHIPPANAFTASLILSVCLTVLLCLLLPMATRFGIRLCGFIAETVGGQVIKRAGVEREDRPDDGEVRGDYPNFESQLKDFMNNVALCKQLYYGTRFIAGLSAGFLPFLISPHPTVSVILSFLIVAAVVVDRVCAPVKNLELNLLAECKVRELQSADLDKESTIKHFNEVMTTFRKGYVEQLAQLEFVMQKIETKPK